MEFLYDEMDRAAKGAFQQHLAVCAECAQRKAEWQGTVRALDEWKVRLPERHRLAKNWAPVVKWAAAAAVLATTAFATGRMSRPELDVAALREEIAKPIQESLERQLATRWQAEQEALRAEQTAIRAERERALAAAVAASAQQVEQLARTVAALREEDRQVVYASLKQLEAQQMAEYRKLRQSLETVAVLTDQSLKDAQRKLVQLASFTAPESSAH